MPPAYDVVRRWVAAVNDARVLDVMALSAGDIEVGGPRGSGRGQPLLREWVERAHLNMHTRRAFARDDRVVLLQRAAWRDDKGTPIAEAIIANRFRVADGRVAAIVRYDDLDVALHDAHLSEQDERAVD
jgi:hypothetical protein